MPNLGSQISQIFNFWENPQRSDMVDNRIKSKCLQQHLQPISNFTHIFHPCPYYLQSDKFHSSPIQSMHAHISKIWPNVLMDDHPMINITKKGVGKEIPKLPHILMKIVIKHFPEKTLQVSYNKKN